MCCQFHGALEPDNLGVFLTPSSAVLRGQPALGGRRLLMGPCCARRLGWRPSCLVPTRTHPQAHWRWVLLSQASPPGPGPVGCGVLVFSMRAWGPWEEGALTMTNHSVGGYQVLLSPALRLGQHVRWAHLVLTGGYWVRISFTVVAIWALDTMSRASLGAAFGISEK